MIINDSDAAKRLNSPLNLINRLAASRKDNKAKEAMSIFIKPAVRQTETADRQLHNQIHTESQPDITLETILENHESQIKLGLAHDSALKLLGNSISQLSAKLDDVKADKLPAAIIAASKVVESIRKERLAVKSSGSEREVHYHFYTPEQKTIEQYEVIEVT